MIMGLIGYPLSHSLSPLMHNQALSYLNFDGIYLPLPTPDLEIAIYAVRSFGWRGVNVTIPYKERVLPLLDRLTPEAEECGAVNLVINERGLLVGYNTDGEGFLDSLGAAGFAVAGRRCTILGAGGAARAIALALARGGADSITIVNRTPARSEGIAGQIGKKYVLPVKLCTWQEADRSVWRGTELLINTTPLGMYPDMDEMPPVDLESLPWDCLVADIVYNPVQTKLLKEAKRRGLNIVTGTGMLVYQGARSFELMTGLKPPVNIMFEVVNDYLGT